MDRRKPDSPHRSALPRPANTEAIVHFCFSAHLSLRSIQRQREKPTGDTLLKLAMSHMGGKGQARKYNQQPIPASTSLGSIKPTPLKENHYRISHTHTQTRPSTSSVQYKIKIRDGLYLKKTERPQSSSGPETEIRPMGRVEERERGGGGLGGS